MMINSQHVCCLPFAVASAHLLQTVITFSFTLIEMKIMKEFELCLVDLACRRLVWDTRAKASRTYAEHGCSVAKTELKTIAHQHSKFRDYYERYGVDGMWKKLPPHTADDVPT